MAGGSIDIHESTDSKLARLRSELVAVIGGVAASTSEALAQANRVGEHTFDVERRLNRLMTQVDDLAAEVEKLKRPVPTPEDVFEFEAIGDPHA